VTKDRRRVPIVRAVADKYLHEMFKDLYSTASCCYSRSLYSAFVRLSLEARDLCFDTVASLLLHADTYSKWKKLLVDYCWLHKEAGL